MPKDKGFGPEFQERRSVFLQLGQYDIKPASPAEMRMETVCYAKRHIFSGQQAK